MKVQQFRLKELCFASRACVLLNIPGRHGNTPPLRVSDVLVLHSNNDRLCCDDGSLREEKHSRLFLVGLLRGSTVCLFFMRAGISGSRKRCRSVSSVCVAAFRQWCLAEQRNETGHQTTRLSWGLFEWPICLTGWQEPLPVQRVLTWTFFVPNKVLHFFSDKSRQDVIIEIMLFIS